MHKPPHDDDSYKEAEFYPFEHLRQKQYLYVRVVKARGLFEECVIGGSNRYVEVRLGNYKAKTSHKTIPSQTNPYPEWNQVFAFLMDKVEATMLEVTVKDNILKDDFMGWVLYDLSRIPTRVQPDDPPAPQWYRLVDRKGDELERELMFAVWWGTQADEVFLEAISGEIVYGPTYFASKVYYSPKLWYLRVNVIEAQDLKPSDRTRFPEVFVKAMLGHQALRTRVSMSKSIHPMWNEDLMFVAAEPFVEHLILSVEGRIAPNEDESLGMTMIPLQYVDRRLDHKPIHSKWVNLEKRIMIEGEKKNEVKFASRLHLRICLEGGYHVLDESTHYSSDLRPTAKQLWKNSIGVLEVGILSADGLTPMETKDGRGKPNAYCVAKYGQKWVRTKTIINSSSPKWNEHYTWEVYDPCTVITIGVFDNFHLPGRNTRIGKVRIRVSTLEPGRVYIHLYPLLVLHPSGVKKMGEINLALRFTCQSMKIIMRKYLEPLLPEMHYLCPLTVSQLDSLIHQATQLVYMRLRRAEPPFTKEVVEYMLDVGCDMWSMRRSKANFLRIKGVFDGLFAVGKWFGRNPINMVAILMIFFMLAMYPELILSFIFLSLFVIGVWNYRRRPIYPPHMDTHLSCADNTHPDELNEEFDTFLASDHDDDIKSIRYDRLRSEAGRVQIVVGDIATQGERLQSLLSWRDPIATSLFVMFCLIAAIVLYAIPFYVVVIQTAIYVLYRQSKLPLVPINFFRRLPARMESML